MKSTEDIYFGKVLLFGEYSILFNSKGLSIPYSHFTGQLSFINEDKYTDLDFATQSNEQLKEFLQYMLDLQSKGEMPCEFDFEYFASDINKGLYFESNIPQGYGIGSSGALVAAVYSKYGINSIKSSSMLKAGDISRLVKIFSKLESLFHGQSSGIDPLNCYIQQPLLINTREDIEIIGIPRTKIEKDSVIFLVDTGKIGKTGPLVNHFLEQMQFSEYADIFAEEYIPFVNQCISSIREGSMKAFFSALEKVSAFQLKYFKRMIPCNFMQAWQWGLDTGSFNLKLCGSGGGGFLLGFTNDYSVTRNYFKELNHEVIPVYKSN